MIELIKEYAGLVTLIIGAVWAVIKLFPDTKKAKESAKQEVEHTEQEKLATEEKELDLDSRRVEASERVASDALEHLADTREENLNLLEEVYKLKKGMVALNHKVDDLMAQSAYANRYICFEEDCSKRRPPLGTYKPKCMNNGEKIQA